MRVYKITDEGRKAFRTGGGDSEEVRVLDYLMNSPGRSATDDQLDVVGERWVVKGLKRRGLIKELTNA